MSNSHPSLAERALTTVVRVLAATVPGLLFFGIAEFYPWIGETAARTLGIALAIAATALALAAGFAPRFVPGSRFDGWSSGSRLTFAGAATGSTVSILLNGSSILYGTEVIFAGLIVLGVLSAVYPFARVQSAPSNLAIRRRDSARRKLVSENEPTATSDTSSRERNAATAEIGRQDVAEGFRTYGDRNESAARLFLILGVAILLASISAALWLVSQVGETAGIATILTRAAISVPGAIVFGVFVRESAARRRYSAWGGLIAIQAESLGAFAADLPDDDRRELEMQFGRAVFRGGDVALETHRPSRWGKSPGGEEGLESVDLARLTEAIRAAIALGGPSSRSGTGTKARAEE